MKKVTLILALFLVMGLSAQQNYVEFTDGGLTYSQDFNGLESTEGATGIIWTNGVSPLQGWYASNNMQETPTDITIYSTGSLNTLAAVGLVSFGTDSDRALGSRVALATGGIAYGVKIKNNTSIQITSLQITYTGEQWSIANANNQYQSLSFGYKLNADIKDAGFTIVPELEFISPKVGSGGTGTTRIDGNLAENRIADINYTINVEIPIGEFMTLRWLDIDDSGVDHMLAIDDFSVTASYLSTRQNVVKSQRMIFYDQGTLSLINDKKIEHVIIYNALGALMLCHLVNATEKQIAVGNLADGIYIVQVSLSDGSKATKRFVK